MPVNRISKKAPSNGHLSIIDEELDAVAPDIPETPAAATTELDPNIRYPEVSLGFGQITTQLVYVTAHIAKKWLATRDVTRQRTLKVHHLISVANDISTGLFRLNGQTIIMDWSGRLIDGQHRLESVVKTGVPISVLVVRGVDPDVFSTIDSVTKRSASDTLKAMGYSNTTAMGGACNLVWKYENKFLTATRVVSQSTVAQVIENHPGLKDSVAACLKMSRICSSQSVPSFCHYVFRRIDPVLADEFFRKLITGENLSKGDPVLTLRERINSKGGSGWREMTAFFFKAWNAARRGQKLSLLRYTETESFPTLV